MKFTPRDYQLPAIQHMVSHRRSALWADMGMGKSVSTLTALTNLELIEPVFPALIIAPLRVAKTTWPEEALKWDHLRGMRVSTITGTPKQRMAALQIKAEIYTINYENIPWLVKVFGKKWPFRTIVSDEATRLKRFRLQNQGASRPTWLSKVAFAHCNRFIELSGTPSPNGLQDLWGQLWFLDQGQRLGRTHEAFKQRWFQRSWSGFGIEPLPHAQSEIEQAVADLCMSLRADDYFDLDKPRVIKVEFELPKKARKLYKDMEHEMFMEIEREGVEAFNAASRTNKCLQLCNGAVYVGEDSSEYKVIHKEKICALESIVEETGGTPLLVAYHYRSDKERILNCFPNARVLDKDPQTIRDWNDGKIEMLVAHPASAGHGLNMAQGSNNLVWFGHSWDLELYLQMIERIGPVRQKQLGLDRTVNIYHIIARNTVEEDVIERLETKKSVQEILMNAVKHRRL